MVKYSWYGMNDERNHCSHPVFTKVQFSKCPLCNADAVSRTISGRHYCKICMNYLD